MKFTEGKLELFVFKIDEPGNSWLRIVVAEGVLDEVEPIKFDDIDLGKDRSAQVNKENRSFLDILNTLRRVGGRRGD